MEKGITAFIGRHYKKWLSSSLFFFFFSTLHTGATQLRNTVILAKRAVSEKSPAKRVLIFSVATRESGPRSTGRSGHTKLRKQASPPTQVAPVNMAGLMLTAPLKLSVVCKEWRKFSVPQMVTPGYAFMI